MLGGSLDTLAKHNNANVDELTKVFDTSCKYFIKRAWAARSQIKCNNNNVNIDN